jgi:hypothetical protein
MTKQLWCISCANQPIVAKDPGSHTRYVFGLLKLDKPTIDIVIQSAGQSDRHIPVSGRLCDACKASIKRGDRACAWSFWKRGDMPEWEAEYLDPITERKQHDW